MKWKAVLIGVLVDMICSAVFSAVATLVVLNVVSMRLTSEGVPADRFASQFNAYAAEYDFAYASAATSFGFIFVALGGYVAGRIADRKELLNGLLVALASTLLMILLSQFMTGQPFPLWLTIAGYIGAFPSGALGGYYAQRSRERRGVVGAEPPPAS